MRQYTEYLMRIHRFAVWTVQIAIFAASVATAFFIRFDFDLPKPFLICMLWGMPAWVVIKSVVFRLFALDRGWWRYVSTSDLFRLLLGNFVGSILSGIVILLFVPVHVRAPSIRST